MKRAGMVCMLLGALMLLGGCSAPRPDITREEILQAYEEAGYEVWSRVYDEPMEYGLMGYIKAQHPDGDYIYFSVFETPEQAEAYKREFYHPAALGLFLSVFAGEAYVPKWEVYGCFVVQYENPVFFAVFQNLLK